MHVDGRYIPLYTADQLELLERRQLNSRAMFLCDNFGVPYAVLPQTAPRLRDFILDAQWKIKAELDAGSDFATIGKRVFDDYNEPQSAPPEDDDADPPEAPPEDEDATEVVECKKVWEKHELDSMNWPELLDVALQMRKSLPLDSDGDVKVPASTFAVKAWILARQSQQGEGSRQEERGLEEKEAATLDAADRVLVKEPVFDADAAAGKAVEDNTSLQPPASRQARVVQQDFLRHQAEPDPDLAPEGQDRIDAGKRATLRLYTLHQLELMDRRELGFVGMKLCNVLGIQSPPVLERQALTQWIIQTQEDLQPLW
mmetsp:Transcript_16364/g.36785  ORF Transcript_16364/g.36785 Transcript_16364/m.36785 type:complete len:314 (+) Transcript_16364:11-952(+)